MRVTLLHVIGISIIVSGEMRVLASFITSSWKPNLGKCGIFVFAHCVRNCGSLSEKPVIDIECYHFAKYRRQNAAVEGIVRHKATKSKLERNI